MPFITEPMCLLLRENPLGEGEDLRYLITSDEDLARVSRSLLRGLLEEGFLTTMDPSYYLKVSFSRRERLLIQEGGGTLHLLSPSKVEEVAEPLRSYLQEDYASLQERLQGFHLLQERERAFRTAVEEVVASREAAEAPGDGGMPRAYALLQEKGLSTTASMTLLPFSPLPA